MRGLLSAQHTDHTTIHSAKNSHITEHICDVFIHIELGKEKVGTGMQVKAFQQVDLYEDIKGGIWLLLTSLLQ